MKNNPQQELHTQWQRLWHQREKAVDQQKAISETSLISDQWSPQLRGSDVPKNPLRKWTKALRFDDNNCVKKKKNSISSITEERKGLCWTPMWQQIPEGIFNPTSQNKTQCCPKVGSQGWPRLFNIWSKIKYSRTTSLTLCSVVLNKGKKCNSLQAWLRYCIQENVAARCAGRRLQRTQRGHIKTVQCSKCVLMKCML